MVSARVRREHAAYVQTRGLSRRRACALLSVARSSLGYQSRLVAKEAPAAATGRPRPLPPTASNHVWAYDFRSRHPCRRPDAKVSDRHDEFTRECLAIDVAGRHSMRARHRGAHAVGAPARRTQYLRSDNGPGVCRRAVLRWLLAAQIETAFIDPGKPWQNGVDESFNREFRHEHLSLQWFRNHAEAAVSIEQWRSHYHEVRPHSSLACQTPHEFKAITETTTRTGRSAAAPPRAEQDEVRTQRPERTN